MDKQEDIDLLEQYLRGELSGKEVIGLKLRLSKEEALSKILDELIDIQRGIRYTRLGAVLEDIQDWEFLEESPVEGAFEKDVSEMIRLERNRELFSEIQGFEDEEAEKETIVLSISRYWWGIAAGILLIIGVGLGWFFMNTQSEYEKLADEYFEPYPVIGMIRGGEIDEVKERAYENYFKGDYNAAITDFEVLVEQGDSLALFYLGVTQLGNNKIADGLKTFLEFEKKHVFLNEEKNWYMGLCYLKQGNLEESLNTLEQLSDPIENRKKENLINKIKELQRNLFLSKNQLK